MKWAEAVVDLKPKHFDDWGKPSSPDFTHANVEVSSTYWVREVILRVIPEDRGVTVCCPEIDLSMCGDDEISAWQNFMDAYADLKNFLLDHESELTNELKHKLEFFKKPISFRVEKVNQG